MKFDVDDLLIKKSLNTIHTPEYDIKSNVQRKIQKQKNYINFKKVIPVTVVAFMMLVLSVSVAAAYIPSFNQLLSIVSPEIAVKLQPIEESSEDNGVRMDVVAAMSDKDMAVIYVTMQDLTDNRIDETIDLYDSYSLTGAHIFNSEMVDYDEATNTATFRIQTNAGENVDGKKMNFRIGAFLSDKQELNEVVIDVNLMDIKNNSIQETVLDMNDSSGGGGDFYEELAQQEKIKVLKPDAMNMKIPEMDTMSITNIGFIGNNLHVQTKWDEENIDDHGYFYLTDAAGSEIFPTSSINFGADEFGKTEFGHNMIEYIFDIDNLDLNNLKLKGDFVTNGKYTKGNWDTTFRLTPVEEQELLIDEEFGNWTVKQMTISSLGVTLSGDTQENGLDDLDVRIKLKDGSTKQFDSITSLHENEKYKLKLMMDLSLDLSNVDAVIVNEIEIALE